MKKKILVIGALLLSMLTMTAQPLTQQQPGHRRALPALHLGATNSQHRVAARGNRPALVFVKGSEPQKAMQKVADADAQLFNGRTLYGGMVNSQLWNNMSITEVPYGVYSFTMGSTEAPKAHITDMVYNFMSGAWGRDRHYGIVPLTIMGVINGARYITIDTRDWKEARNTVWDTTHGTYSLIASTMAYDPTSDVFYAFQYKEDLSGLNWVRINKETDEMEQIAQYRGKTAVMTLACTPGGQMYYIDAAGDLYTLNKENGRGALVGNTGVTPAAYNQSMTYDAKTATFLWAAQSSEGSVLYSVNPETAETKHVMAFKNNEQFVSLYMTDNEAPDAAPAAVGRPRLTTEGGSLTGTIAFTMPSKTYSGQTLSGNVNLNLWVDGENLKGVQVAAGSAVKETVTLTEGNHYIAITTDNDGGFSPLRYIYQYVGFDTPKAVTDVVFTEGGGQNTITWKAPTAGVNSGYIDAANLTYDIVRMPDSVTVATGLSVLTYTEPTPQAMHAYSYRVIASNHDHKADYTESNIILCGKSFTVPYKQEFADPDVLKEYFTVVDNNNDGNTWRQGYTTEVRIDKTTKVDYDDWLISPPITMETGIKYRFFMNMKSFTQNYPEDFEILIGTDPTDLSTFKVLAHEDNFTKIASEFGDYTVDFMVDEQKDYYMAMRYCSKGEKGSLIMIRYFSVEAIGNSAAPAQPADFAVTPDADDLLKATITLKAPSLNLQGETLTTISSIEIYRDSEEQPVHTWTVPSPGQSLSWTDEQVPALGLHTYTAIAISTEGRGEPISMEKFIGVYAAPYFENFENRKYAELWTTEHTFTDDLNNWWGWRWTENDNTYGRYMNLYYYLMENIPTTIWLYTPKMKLDENAVYTVSFDANMQYEYYKDMTFGLYRGTEPKAEAMTTLVSNLPSTSYNLEPHEILLVNNEAGNCYLGIKAYGATKADYFNANLDNFRLTYRTSALAPYQITNFKAVADKDAELKATLTFNAPKTNYRKETLDANKDLTINIFRGKNATIPAQTLQVKPGEQVTWIDETALHGKNYYTVTCDNEFGRGEVIVDTVFVGIDVPGLVENFSVRGSADNKNAVLSWKIPSKGANGGLVIKSSTTFNVYEYNLEKDELTLLAENLTDNSYTVEREEQATQQVYYYAVAAVNSEGVGQASASSIVLGKLYELPFHESFEGGSLTTQLWQPVPMVQGATSCGVTNPAGNGYNQCKGAQDEDGGCIYIYNGYQAEIHAGALLVFPKIKLSTINGNELHFWAYHYKETGYSQPAQIVVAISTNDAQMNTIKNAVFNISEATEKGWMEHVVNLDSYRTSDFVTLGLMGTTGGYQDVIYIDNITVKNDNASGIANVRNNKPSAADCFDLQGRKVNPANYRGIFILNGKKFVK